MTGPGDRSSERSKHYWMPFTSNREFHLNPRVIEGASGAYYRDSSGRQILDGLAGLWCSVAGHCRPEIAAAVERQLGELDYAPAFQFGHPLAFELAERVTALAPDGIDHAFFTCSGSDAVDTALKMAIGYWRLRGQPSKTKIIGRARGYHGVNFGGLSAGGISNNRKLFGRLLDTAHLPYPALDANRFAKGEPEHGAEWADALEDILQVNDASTIAAVIVEPFAGSAGVVPAPRGYLKKLRALCDKHDILLIFDEVISGFGRTGEPFGAQFFGVTPDLMTVAKGLTNGAVPMGAVLAHAKIYDAYMANGGLAHAVEFPHGYTYSGHPVACAAALAALDIYERDGLFARAAGLARTLETAVHELMDAPYVVDIRNIGLAAAIQVEAIPDQPGRRAYDVAMACWRDGVYVRYAGETIQIAPAYICTDEEIYTLTQTVHRALSAMGQRKAA